MTPRDTILAQRAGFVAGVRASTTLATGVWGPACQAVAESEAERAYPMPKVLRPRVIAQGQSEYKIENGQLMVRYTGNLGPYMKHAEWRKLDRTRDDYLALVELFYNPTEEVEI